MIIASVRDKRYRIANRATYFTSCDAKLKRHRLDQNKLRCIEFIHLRYRTYGQTIFPVCPPLPAVLPRHDTPARTAVNRDGRPVAPSHPSQSINNLASGPTLFTCCCCRLAVVFRLSIQSPDGVASGDPRLGCHVSGVR